MKYFSWYKEKHGERLDFLSDTEVMVKDFGWSVCMFENQISNEICDKFDITFKIISFGGDGSHLDFCIGYATGNTLEESIQDWGTCLGEEDNSDTSASWAFWASSLLYNGFGDYGNINNSINYSTDDLLRILFDFKAKTVKVYHNGKEKNSKDLKATKFWIGLSMRYEGNQITMVEYKYD